MSLYLLQWLSTSCLGSYHILMCGVFHCRSDILFCCDILTLLCFVPVQLKQRFFELKCFHLSATSTTLSHSDDLCSLAPQYMHVLAGFQSCCLALEYPVSFWLLMVKFLIEMFASFVIHWQRIPFCPLP